MDVHICGSCRSEYNDFVAFFEHKKLCQSTQHKNSTEQPCGDTAETISRATIQPLEVKEATPGCVTLQPQGHEYAGRNTVDRTNVQGAHSVDGQTTVQTLNVEDGKCVLMRNDNNEVVLVQLLESDLNNIHDSEVMASDHQGHSKVTVIDQQAGVNQMQPNQTNIPHVPEPGPEPHVPEPEPHIPEPEPHVPEPGPHTINSEVNSVLRMDLAHNGSYSLFPKSHLPPSLQSPTDLDARHPQQDNQVPSLQSRTEPTNSHLEQDIQVAAPSLQSLTEPHNRHPQQGIQVMAPNLQSPTESSIRHFQQGIQVTAPNLQSTTEPPTRHLKQSNLVMASNSQSLTDLIDTHPHQGNQVMAHCLQSPTDPSIRHNQQDNQVTVPAHHSKHPPTTSAAPSSNFTAYLSALSQLSTNEKILLSMESLPPSSLALPQFEETSIATGQPNQVQDNQAPGETTGDDTEAHNQVTHVVDLDLQMVPSNDLNRETEIRKTPPPKDKSKKQQKTSSNKDHRGAEKTQEVKERKHTKMYMCGLLESCTYVTPYLKDLERHMRTHTGDKPFKCNYCNKRFSRMDKLNLHERSQHKNLKPYTCDICSYKAVDSSTLKRHMSIHTNERKYECQLCTYTARTSSQLTVHLRSHTGDSPFNCPYCPSKFKMKSDMKRHLRVHTGEKPYKCDSCDVSCTTRGNLQSHKRTHHTTEKQMKCHACDYTTSSKRSLREHCKLHQTVDSSLVCPVCQYISSSLTTQKAHLKTHSSRWKCRHCGQQTNSRDQLNQHYKNCQRMKIQDRPGKQRKEEARKRYDKAFFCNKCGESFVRKDSLRSHLRLHEERDRPRDISAIVVDKYRVFMNSTETENQNGATERHNRHRETYTAYSNTEALRRQAKPLADHTSIVRNITTDVAELGPPDIGLHSMDQDTLKLSSATSMWPPILGQSSGNVESVVTSANQPSAPITQSQSNTAAQPLVPDGNPITQNLPAPNTTIPANSFLYNSQLPGIQLIQNFSFPFLQLPSGQIVAFQGQPINSICQLPQSSDQNNVQQQKTGQGHTINIAPAPDNNQVKELVENIAERQNSLPTVASSEQSDTVSAPLTLCVLPQMEAHNASNQSQVPHVLNIPLAPSQIFLPTTVPEFRGVQLNQQTATGAVSSTVPNPNPLEFPPNQNTSDTSATVVQRPICPDIVPQVTSSQTNQHVIDKVAEEDLHSQIDLQSIELDATTPEYEHVGLVANLALGYHSSTTDTVTSAQIPRT